MNVSVFHAQHKEDMIFLTERCDSGSPPASQLAFPALPPTANICHFHTQVKAQLKNFAQTTHIDTSTYEH